MQEERYAKKLHICNIRTYNEHLCIRSKIEEIKRGQSERVKRQKFLEAEEELKRLQIQNEHEEGKHALFQKVVQSYL